MLLPRKPCAQDHRSVCWTPHIVCRFTVDLPPCNLTCLGREEGALCLVLSVKSERFFSDFLSACNRHLSRHGCHLQESARYLSTGIHHGCDSSRHHHLHKTEMGNLRLDEPAQRQRRASSGASCSSARLQPPPASRTTALPSTSSRPPALLRSPHPADRGALPALVPRSRISDLEVGCNPAKYPFSLWWATKPLSTLWPTNL